MTRRRRWWAVVRRLFIGNPRRDWLDPRMPQTLNEWRARQ